MLSSVCVVKFTLTKSNIVLLPSAGQLFYFVANCFLRSQHSRLRSQHSRLCSLKQVVGFCSANTRYLSDPTQLHHLEKKVQGKYKRNDSWFVIRGFPPQLTVTCSRSFNTMSFSTIIRVGPMPVLFSSGKKNNTFEGCFPVCLHNCLRDMTDSNSDFADGF